MTNAKSMRETEEMWKPKKENPMIMKRSVYIEKCRKAANDMKKSRPKPENLENLELDHIVPINYGYEHNFPWEIISLPENLDWIPRDENRSKSASLTPQGLKLINKWRDDGLIVTPIALQSQNESADSLFDNIRESLKNDTITSCMIPTNVAVKIPPVWCQRDETLRYSKTRNAMGRVPLDTHKVMMFFLFPDGQFYRGDGNTRSYIWANNLQFPDYEVPKNILGIFIKVDDEKHAEQLYHSIDSKITAETFAEKLSGYMRAKGYAHRLPLKWKKGESVYDIAVVALDNYVHPGDSECVTLEWGRNEAERAAQTSEKLNYIIEELVVLGKLFPHTYIPKQLTSPLIGMFIKYMMKYKDDKIYDKMFRGIKFLINHITGGQYAPWYRIHNDFDEPELNNLLIMVDELQTTADISKKVNPRTNLQTRAILSDGPTQTTRNIQDRRMYCGWIAYCFDKYLAGEVMNEDIIFDVTAVPMIAEIKHSNALNAKTEAQSLMVKKYDKFWENGL